MNDKTNKMSENLELIFPLPIALVITKRREKINVCPINWQVVSTKYELPITICIGLSNGSYSLETIQQTNEFTLAYPSKKQLKDTIYCGTVSGRDIDKLEKTAFQFDPSEKITSPHLLDAVINFECQVNQIVVLETFSIVIASVVVVTSSTKSMLDKIYALGNMNYGTIAKISIDQIGRG